MTKPLAALVAIVTLAAATVVIPNSADARWHHHRFPIAPVIGGLAAGALLGAALATPRYYYGPYMYYQPDYGPRCYIRREQIWDGWRWRTRRIQECY